MTHHNDAGCASTLYNDDILRVCRGDPKSSTYHTYVALVTAAYRTKLLDDLNERPWLKELPDTVYEQILCLFRSQALLLARILCVRACVRACVCVGGRAHECEYVHVLAYMLMCVHASW